MAESWVFWCGVFSAEAYGTQIQGPAEMLAVDMSQNPGVPSSFLGV